MSNYYSLLEPTPFSEQIQGTFTRENKCFSIPGLFRVTSNGNEKKP